ncbi:MAG: chromate resistance protein [bacterium]|nr:chromate resistance protein [bacterium]
MRYAPTWLAVLGLCVGCGRPAEQAPASSSQSFYSIGLHEPDKVCSAWVISRHIRPGATVELLPQGSAPPDGAVPFDMPAARWARHPRRSTFRTILEMEEVDDRALENMASYVDTAELSFWSLEPGSPAEQFDQTLRDLVIAGDLQATYAYLDSVYEADGAVGADAVSR